MKKIRILSLLLILVMVLGLFAGCKPQQSASLTDDESKQVTLRWVFPWSTQRDLSLVNAEINKILGDYLPNTQLEIICEPGMADKWQLWMAGQTSFDIAHTGFSNDLLTEINKDSFLELDELIENYAPTIKEEMTGLYSDLYDTGKYDGKLYGIPCIQYHIKETKGLTFSKGVVEYLDVAALKEETWNNPKTGEKFYQIIDEFLQTAEAQKGKISLDMRELWKNGICKRGYTFIGGADSNLCYDTYADEVKIIDFYTTEEFKLWMQYARKWYEAGYISKDILTGTGVGGTSTIGGMGGVYTSRHGMDENGLISSATSGAGYTTMVIDNPANDVRTSYNVGSLLTYLSIPITAENPARAMRLIELLRSEEGQPILNMIAYGIEGTHYEKTGENSIKAFDYEGQGNSNSAYGIANWMVGNMFNAYTCSPFTDSVVNYGRNYYENVLPNTAKHALYGYCFNTDKVQLKMNQLLTNNSEYGIQLAFGTLSDYQKTYETLMARNETAGIADVIAELQSQADAYIGK